MHELGTALWDGLDEPAIRRLLARRRCDDEFAAAAKEMGLDRDTLRFAAQIADCFDAEELHQYARRGITLAHLRQVILLPAADSQERFLRRAVDHNWSPAELADAVRRRPRQPQPSKPSRKPKPPRDVKRGFARFHTMARRFLEADALIFGDQFDLPSEICYGLANDVTPELIEQVAQAAKILDEIVAKATENAQRFRQVLPRLTKTLAGQLVRADTEAEAHGGIPPGGKTNSPDGPTGHPETKRRRHQAAQQGTTAALAFCVEQPRQGSIQRNG